MQDPAFISVEPQQLGGAEGNEDPDDDGDEAIDGDDVDDDEDFTDPFQTHFAHPEEEDLSRRLKALSEGRWSSERHEGSNGRRLQVQTPGEQNAIMKWKMVSSRDLKLKQRLRANDLGGFSDLDRDLVPPIYTYQDALFGARTVANIDRLRELTCLHALNHLFKTRDRVLKNNAKLLAAIDTDSALEYRDQGFTRPKVLFLLETRQACARMVEMLVRMGSFEQQENKKRFLESFSQPDTFSDEKPADFRELFDGNDDNDFRLGMKITRKAVKLYASFLTSDVIFGSPLGLRRAIETAKDADFLSSIELAVVDQADAMLMQNWDHVDFVFGKLNQQPKSQYGDITRLRPWILNGNAAQLRQTLVFSAYITPELNALFSKHMTNVFGRVKILPAYPGVLTALGQPLRQTFTRVSSSSPAADPDARFRFFTTAVLPALVKAPRPAHGGPGIVVFVPSYLDFVRLRNYFAAAATTEHISFGCISEYADGAAVRRARAHFQAGRHAFLLYTGRVHHFRRYHIRGAKHIVMYGVPENPVFYEEMVGGWLGDEIVRGVVSASETRVRVLFSKWDSLRLERVVGSARIGSMLGEKGDTFDFL